MKLSQKLHSALVSKSYLKKSKLFLSLTAIGVLGGFFVAYEAIVASDEIVVNSPASGVYWNGIKTIRWDTSTCSDTNTDTVNVMLADANGAVLTNLAVNVPCKDGSKAWNTTTYPGGSYKILVQRNIEGTHQGYTGTFTTDNVAPAITTSTLTSPNGGELWGGAKKTITWNKDSITDGNPGTNPISLYYFVGNATPVQIATGEANDGSYEWTLPTDVDLSGVMVQIFATDLATNTSSDTSDATFKIDTVKPVVAVTSLNGGEKLKGGSTQTLAWTVNGNDNTAADAEKVEYTSNGTTWVTIPLTNKVWTLPTDNTGTAKIRVSATDLAGNIGSDESDSAFMIDSTAPKATFVSASDYFGPITFADRTFRGTVSDVNGSGVASVKVIIEKNPTATTPEYWNGDTWQTTIASVGATLDVGKANWSYVVPSTLVLADGATYSIVPVATDVAGNEDLLATGDLLTYDSSTPLLSITTPVAGTLTKTVSQTVSGTFTEPNIQTITVNGSAATLTVGTFSKDISLVEGANTITVIATDKAGNYETKTVLVTLDTHAPTVAVTPLTTDNNKPVITGTVDDNLAIVKVKVGGKEYTANIANGAWTVSTDIALADGKYNVVAIATDEAGNIGSELTTDELVVDTTDPIISVITTPVADEIFTSNTSTADVFLTFTASDVTTAATCTYQIDGAEDSSSTSCAGSSIPVSDGRHTITVTVKDGVNKIASATSSSFVVNTDKKLTVGATGADFPSISTAVSKASGGDTIDVAAGEYTESVVIPTGLTGLIIKGAADKTSIIKPTGVSVLEANGTSAITVKTGSTGITINGFTFNCDGKDYGVYSIGSGVTIQNNSISGYKKNGIFVKGGTVTIDKNIITGSGSVDFSGDSIYTRDGATLLITNNTLTGNGFSTPPSATATGLSIHAGDTATITGNTITGNSWGIHIKGAENSAQANPKIISAENNVISGNAVANVYYENFGFAPSTGYYKMSKNWWGISAKSTIASKIVTNDITKPTFTVVPTDYVNFAPWYLNKGMSKLSDDKTLTVGKTGAEDFTSIKDAIDAVASAVTANAQINVATGTYNENIVIPAGMTGLKISGHDRSDTFIKSGTGNVITMNGPATIEGFTIDGLGTGLYGVYEQNVAGVTIQNNIIKSYKQNGVYADGGSISVLNNDIVDDGEQTDFSADAIYTRGGLTATITGNDLSGNIFTQITGTSGGTSAGISIHAGDNVNATGNTIHGNTIGIHAKTGAIVNATGNKIYSNDIGFLYENENNEAVSGTFNATNNWWGTAKKSEISAKIEKATTINNVTQTLAPTNVVNFNPWYLDEGKVHPSSDDTIGPVVVLSTDDADGIVKTEAGKTIKITANITDATIAGAETGIDDGVGVAPSISITNGKNVSGAFDTLTAGLTRTPGTDNWIYLWTVPAGDETATISILASDFVGNGVSATNGTTSLTIDNSAPTLSEIIAVTTPTKNNTPEYKFNSSEAGTATFVGCSSAQTNVSAGDNLVTFGTAALPLVDGVYGSCIIKVSDVAGNSSALAVSSFTVDTVAPIIGNHANVTVEATSASGATVMYDLPTSTDAIDAAPTISCSPISGSSFLLGTTLVTCTSVDAAKNQSTSTFNVIVKDTTKPEIALHGNITKEATSSTGAIVEYVNPDATDNIDGAISASCSPASGSVFGITTTTVTCNAQDAAGNHAIPTTFTVTVMDSTKPVIVLAPADGTDVSVGNPEIKATFSDIATGIEVNSINMILDDVDVTQFADKKDVTEISFSSVGLSETIHSATVTVSDIAGNSASITNKFRVKKSNKSITISSNKSSLPADGTSTATITATLTSDNKPVSGATVIFSKNIGTLSATSAVTNAEGKAIITLTSAISGNETVVASYGVGSEMARESVEINFTEVLVDTALPTATSSPADDATGVAVNVSPVVTFSEEVGAITGTNVQLRKYDTTAEITASLTTTVENGKTIVTINPESDLDNNTVYYFYISGVKDLAKNPMISWTKEEQDSHSFRTIAAHVPVTSINISLKVGWNLISLPLIPTSNKTVDIISSISSKVNIVQYYDDTAGWVSYSPTAGVAGLEKMEDGKGYWIDMKEATTLTITGTEMPLPGSSMPLYKIKKGWNLIGFKSVSEMKSSSYLDTGVDYVVVYGFDGTSNSYPTVAYPSSDSSQKTDNYMKPGLGYWLYAKDEGYIVPVIK